MIYVPFHVNPASRIVAADALIAYEEDARSEYAVKIFGGSRGD